MPLVNKINEMFPEYSLRDETMCLITKLNQSYKVPSYLFCVSGSRLGEFSVSIGSSAAIFQRSVRYSSLSQSKRVGKHHNLAAENKQRQTRPVCSLSLSLSVVQCNSKMCGKAEKQLSQGIEDDFYI